MGDEYDELYGGGSGAARAAPPAPQAGAPPPPPPSSSDPYAVLEREQPPGLPPGLSGLANIKQEPGAPPGPPPGGLPPPPGPPQGFHAHDQRAYQAPPGPPPGAPPPYSPHGGAPPHAAPGTAFPPGPPGAPGGFPPPPAPGQDPRSGAPPPPPPADDDDDDVEIHLNTAVVPAGPPGGRGLPGRPPPRLSGYPSRPPPAGGGPQSRSRWGGHMGRGAIAPYSMPEGMGPIHGGGRAYVRTDEFGNAAPVTEEAHAQGDPMNAKFPSKAGPDDWILIPEHQRVEPEEYTEFRELGYGRLYDLDLDRCVMKGGMAGPWLDAAADPGEFFNYGLTKETFQEYQRQVQMFRKTYDLKSDIKLMESDRMISPGDREVPPEARRGGGGPPARPATWGRYVGRGYDAAWLPWTHDLVRRDEEPYVCTILVKSTEDPIEEPPNELALAAAPLTPPQGRGGDHAAETRRRRRRRAASAATRSTAAPRAPGTPRRTLCRS
ncbi:unnamed protein product [Pedinophyceae sp. YPF-701]|nr:unnamed protein product [Pedinophyceae sp. YPF-701]